MDWKEIYKQKLVSVEDAAKVIKSGDRVFPMAASTFPKDIILELTKRRDELQDVTLLSGLVFYNLNFFAPESKGHVDYISTFMGPYERMAYKKGFIDVYINMFGKIDWTAKNVFKANVFITEVSAPDENGNMSYGPMVFFSDTAAKVADTVIVVVNKQTPHVYGEKASINVKDVSYIVESDSELPVLPQAPISEIDKQIAHHIVSYIDDGSTLQLGIGGLGNAIGYFLKDHKDLGIHSEMMVDSMVELVEKGVITGSKKTLHPGKSIFSFAFGSRKLYDLIDKNEDILGYPLNYVVDPYVIGQNNNLISINNALMCDLTGQVCSESIGFEQFSGTGGQLDFVRGAQLSPGGKSFIALESTTKGPDGTLLSRINCVLPPGAAITTPRNDVQYIVTEYGVADVNGKTIKERVREMIKIAHPQFREQLEKEAFENHLCVN